MNDTEIEYLLTVAKKVKSLVSLEFILGDKSLGEYYITNIYPKTLQLSPVDEYRADVWVPNPLALDSALVVRKYDHKFTWISMWEHYEPQPKEVWKLTFTTSEINNDV